MAGYISDGYTRTDGYISGAIPEPSGERLYDALEFTYRPATRMDNVRCDAEVAIALKNKDFDPDCAVNAEKIACKFVADRVKSWNLKDVGIHNVPVSAQACERMHPYLFGNLYRIVRGVQASDKKPDAEKVPPTDEDMAKNLQTGSDS
jgi:hypothetical protein